LIILKRYFSQAHFSIDKKIIFGTVNPTSLRILSLSEGGGGWRKTFKNFSYQNLESLPEIQFRISI
jgi:hypothetical protein